MPHPFKLTAPPSVQDPRHPIRAFRNTRPPLFRPHLLSIAVAVSAVLALPPPTVEAAGTSSAAWEAAQEVVLSPGLQITMGPTRVVVRQVTEDVLTFDWTHEDKQETVYSKRRREAFERNPPVRGIGEPDPEPPTPEYEPIIRRGTITSHGYRQANMMLEPPTFLELQWTRPQTRFERNGLLWMSPDAFRELRSTRHTEWGVANFEGRLIELLSDSGDLEIEADRAFHSRNLEIDGRAVAVQTIVAGNQKVTYTILDNAQNPLILEVDFRAHPSSAVDFVPFLGWLTLAAKASWGYEVTAVRTADAR